ncbi:succinate dehydrogenase, hydrophobic membrane anchor protein [Bacillus sp. NP157]|nr:succinate dehydrogenase, hydrophobic membrane anchor protein [Bacillus sp. NP157]
MAHDFRHPLKRARNTGSADSGPSVWMAMPLTSWTLIPVSVWVVVLVLSLVHSDSDTALHRIGHPANATVLAVFLLLMLWHTELGLRNIFEDYIHTHWIGMASTMVMRFVLIVLAVVMVGSPGPHCAQACGRPTARSGRPRLVGYGFSQG